MSENIKASLSAVLEGFSAAVDFTNDALYTYILIILLVLAGLYFTVRTRFAPFRLFGEQIRAVMEKPSDGKNVSSFQALMVSTASRVGTGNIVGVATAIAAGGPGALFWMIIAAFFGMATKYAEGLLAVKYRTVDKDGHILGGPFYYIEKGLGKKFGIGIEYKTVSESETFYVADKSLASRRYDLV